VASSIVHPASSAVGYKNNDLGLSGTSNSVALTFSDSDTPPPTTGDQASADVGNSSNTADSALFAKGYRLRQNAPVIDKGGAIEAGESATDVNGDPRQVGAGTDKGADEFVNLAPKASFELAPASVRQDQLVGFAATATDPEQVNGAGGGIAEYQWDFGDGTKETTTGPTTLHKYAQIGGYTVTLVVKDIGGLTSSPVTKPVTVTDGVAPAATILTPADGAKLRLNPKKKKHAKRKPKPRQLTLLGRATDASGVSKVEVTLYATQRSEKKKKLNKGECLFYTGRTFSKKSCTKEVWLPLQVSGDGWQLKTRKGVRIPPGRWVVRVRATDATGLLSSEFTVKARSLVRFTVK
jgi:PKD repeat protein